MVELGSRSYSVFGFRADDAGDGPAPLARHPPASERIDGPGAGGPGAGDGVAREELLP
jgi:hypothetical protein